MIVGFPGETIADFEELCQFVEEARFDRLGVFSYSDEETSRSYDLNGKVDLRTINHRKRRLMAVQRRVSRSLNRRLKGREMTVMVEGPSSESDLLWQARMATQAPEIDGVCLINDCEGRPPAAGEFRTLRITRALDYDLIGSLLPPQEEAPNHAANPFTILGAPRSSP
jgi:ribosomal protein S12 methylthiotransferase